MTYPQLLLLNYNISYSVQEMNTIKLQSILIPKKPLTHTLMHDILTDNLKDTGLHLTALSWLLRPL